MIVDDVLPSGRRPKCMYSFSRLDLAKRIVPMHCEKKRKERSWPTDEIGFKVERGATIADTAPFSEPKSGDRSAPSFTTG